MRRFGFIVALALLSGVLAWLTMFERPLESVASSSVLSSLVFVTEDTAVNLPGCDAISVMDLHTGDRLFSGPTHLSPGRLAASPDFQNVIATVSNKLPYPPNNSFLYRIRPLTGDFTQWAVQEPIVGKNFASYGDVVVLSDNDTLLVSTVGDNVRPGPNGLVRQFPRPYGIHKYRLSDIGAFKNGGWPIGPSVGSVETKGVPAKFLLTDDERYLHALLDNNTLVTVDVAAMEILGGPIALPPVAIPGGFEREHLGSLVHAALVDDGVHILANQWWPADISVVNVQSGQVESIRPPGELEVIGGLAVNRALNNSGLIAVHGVVTLAVYRYVPPYAFTLLASTPLPDDIAIGSSPMFGGQAPIADVAWSADGRQIIVAAPSMDTTRDFAVYDFHADRGGLTLELEMEACGDEQWFNAPNAVLTANGYITPEPSSSPAPSHTAVPTRTRTAVPTRTSTKTPVATGPAISTSVVSDFELYLPVSVRDGCPDVTMDRVLVVLLDASTSMTGELADGRLKIEVVEEAVVELFRQMIRPDENSGRKVRGALIGFNSSARIEQGVTGDVSALERGLGRLRTRVQEGTRLDEAFRRVDDLYAGGQIRDGDEVSVVLLTDGMPNRIPTPVPSGSQESVVLAAADAIKARGASVHAIGVGEERQDGTVSGVNMRLLQQVSSGSRYVHRVSREDEVIGVFSEIRTRIECP